MYIIYVLNQVFLFDIKKLCMQNILFCKKLICFTGYLKYVIKVKQKLFERFCLLLSHIRLEVRVFMQGKWAFNVPWNIIWYFEWISVVFITHHYHKRKLDMPGNFLFWEYYFPISSILPRKWSLSSNILQKVPKRTSSPINYLWIILRFFYNYCCNSCHKMFFF